MIRTGYLRWEIEAEDRRVAGDAWSREVILRARPTYRRLLVQGGPDQDVADQFVRGQTNYDAVLKELEGGAERVEIRLPDVGPHIYRYSESDRVKMPRFWMDKLSREVRAFAQEVVRTAAGFPRLVLASALVRAGYRELVAWETFRVIEGRSRPEPTIEDPPMAIDQQVYAQGVPELVAAELVRDVVTPEEFDEFRTHDRVTITNGDRIYQIHRTPHAQITVWDARTRRGLDSLCIIFRDPGMPPSDEVVMKYLLAKHQPEMLHQVANSFGPPPGTLDR